jgi:hypothetical protein
MCYAQSDSFDKWFQSLLHSSNLNVKSPKCCTRRQIVNKPQRCRRLGAVWRSGACQVRTVIRPAGDVHSGRVRHGDIESGAVRKLLMYSLRRQAHKEARAGSSDCIKNGFSFYEGTGGALFALLPPPPSRQTIKFVVHLRPLSLIECTSEQSRNASTAKCQRTVRHGH